MSREVTCALCEIVFGAPLTGRPPRFCSKRCRQAAYNEEHRRVPTRVRDLWRRRRDARSTSERLVELARLEEPAYYERSAAYEKADQRANEAWPSPFARGQREPELWQDYLSSRAIVHDESPGVTSR